MNTLQPPPPPITDGTTPKKEAKKKLVFSKIEPKKGLRIGLYGTAGVGKTTLAASMKGNKVFFDLDDSLPILQEQLTPDILQTIQTIKIETWQEILDALDSDGWDGINTIIIDTVTKAEELAQQYMLETIPNEKGKFVKRIEEYGFGKGYTFLFDTFLPLLAALDRHCKAGRNVVLIMHDCTSTVPNPTGDDYLRYEPRLSNPASGKSSIRLRVREWLDHLFYLGYETLVDENGKASGGQRILIPAERPYCMAKSRRLSQDIRIQNNQNPLDLV